MALSSFDKTLNKAVTAPEALVLPVLLATSASHLLNDVVQALLPSIYPVLKTNYQLSFTQIGVLTLAFQLTASLLQPLVGAYTDKHPMPFSAVFGMGISLIGLLVLAFAHFYFALVLAAMMIGIGSSVFHPEAARIARSASGGHFGFAQSLFQLGGNGGTSLGPLMAFLIIVPFGQNSISYFVVVPLLAMGILYQLGRWYKNRLGTRSKQLQHSANRLSRGRIVGAIAILLLLMFSKFFYTASLGNYYTFYLIDHFHLSIGQSQIYLFLFLASLALGTLIGGPIGDRYGRLFVIWVSILGILPMTLLLPYVDLTYTIILSIVIGLVLSSAFSAIIVYAQELLPGRVGLISGMFFGFAFGLAGLAAAVLGALADYTSIETVFKLCAFLPMIGILTYFLPREKEMKG